MTPESPESLDSRPLPLALMMLHGRVSSILALRNDRQSFQVPAASGDKRLDRNRMFSCFLAGKTTSRPFIIQVNVPMALSVVAFSVYIAFFVCMFSIVFHTPISVQEVAGDLTDR